MKSTQKKAGNAAEKSSGSNRIKEKSSQEESGPGNESTPFTESGWGNEQNRAYASSPKIPPPSDGAGGPGIKPIESPLRSKLEQHFRTDLSEVRISSHPESRVSADRLSSYAYTYGQTIHMGSAGEKLTGQRRNALLAHEVTHTLQQKKSPPVAQAEHTRDSAYNAFERQADDAAYRFMFSQQTGKPFFSDVSPARGMDARVQAADLKTDWGEFVIPEFEALHYAPQPGDIIGGSVPAGYTDEIGAKIEIHFKPGERVDSKIIGLTQIQKTYRQGTPSLMIGNRAMTMANDPTQAGYGFSIDQGAGNPNPMYTASSNDVKAGGSADKMGDYNDFPIENIPAESVSGIQKAYLTNDIKKWGTGWGEYYYNESGARNSEAKPATLYDAPALQYLPFAPNTGQFFETAAYAAEGNPNSKINQEGLYYGSINWGWKRDEAGNFSLIKPEFVTSKGVPSNDFLTAAKVWNESKTEMEFKLLKPIPKYHMESGRITASGVNLLPGTIVIHNTSKGIADMQKNGGYISVENEDIICWVKSADLYDSEKALPGPKTIAIGNAAKETIDLTLPEFSTEDSKFQLPDGSKIKLPAGTRLEKLNGGNYRVADGVHAGKIGTIIKESSVSQITLGGRKKS